MADLKIFKVDDYSWYVAHNLMEFLNWYHENIDSIETEEDLDYLEIINPEDGGMWSDENITQEDIDALGDLEELGANGIGALLRRGGEIYKYQTYAAVLGDEDIKEPYEISSTEW